MELPAENRRTAVLALAALGALLVVALTVFTVFDGDDDGDAGGGNAGPAATAGGPGGTSGGSGSASGSGPATGTAAPDGTAATPLVELSEVAEAHGVMTAYMAGLGTYDHTSEADTWTTPLLELTSGEPRMRQATVLPSGKEWAVCEAEKCTSKGTAVVVRDALIADDLVRDSGRTISSLVEVTTERTAGDRPARETNQWLVTVKEEGGQWVVSGFDVFGLGDVGASEESGE